MYKVDTLGIMIKRINTLFETEVNNILKKYDITKAQGDVLRYLNYHKNEKVSQRDIEKHFGISNPTVSGILNRLEVKDLIERKSCEKDARIKYITRTPKAEKLYEKIRYNIKRKEAQLKVGLSAEEEEQLFDLLHRILENMSK
jgi:Transcriptional regulators